MTRVVASASLVDVLCGPARAARVLARSRAASYLTVDRLTVDRLTVDRLTVDAARRGDPSVIALLARDAVRVPIGVVTPLPADAGPFDALTPGLPALVGEGRLVVAGVAYRPVRWWDPRVPRLRAGLLAPGADRRAAAVAALAGRRDPGVPAAALAALGDALGDVARSPDRVPGTLATAVAALVGLGEGLTPAGDDVLAGALVTLVAAGCRDVAARLAEAVAARAGATVPVSAALLAEAAQGRAVPQLAAALRAVVGVGDLEDAATRLGAVGHRSGPALALGVAVGVSAARSITRTDRRAA